jgi:hypothetical protein
MVTSTDILMDALEKWLQAVRAGDFAAARLDAQNLVMKGQPLATHPSFVDCFKRHRANDEPVDALLILCQFLTCATDGRAHVLQTATKRVADGHDGSQ